MSTKVQLPPGCYGFDCKDGTRYTGKPGQSVTVEDRHARALNEGQFGQSDFISAKGATSIGTKRTTECTNPNCRRRGHAWNEVCPRCGAEMQEI